MPSTSRQPGKGLVVEAKESSGGAIPPVTDDDHVRGRRDAPVVLVEYADYECPYCGQAEPVVRELLREFGDVRYVWRHLPLSDVHPRAQLAAEAADAAAEQGIVLEVVKLPQAKRGFVLLPRRWVVERSNAWVARFRRLARDYERLPDTLAGLHFLAFAILLLSRFASLMAESA